MIVTNIPNLSTKVQRYTALKEAKPFLKKYKKIFGDQTLSNKTCQISILKTKDKTLQILCISKVATENTN